MAGGLWAAGVLADWTPEDPLTVTDPVERLQLVRTPLPYDAVVHDQTAQLIVAHRPDDGDATLRVVAIEANGQPAESGLDLAIPAIAGVDGLYAVGLALHPGLPLLYVLCDAPSPGDRDAAPWMTVPRLHVYLVREGGLTLIRSVGAGLSMDWGQTRAGLAIDPGGRRLVLPHLRDAAGPVIGSLALDARGMPRMDAGDALLIDRQSLGALRGFVAGLGLVAGSEDAVVLAAPQGLATWDRINRRAHLVNFPLPDAPRLVNLGGRPDETAVYLAGQDGDYLAVMFQARGYLTLWPRRIRIENTPAPAFRGIPTVMPSAAAVAVADRHGVYVFGRRPDGMPDGTLQFTPLERRDYRVVAWSERFRQLYVINP